MRVTDCTIVVPEFKESRRLNDMLTRKLVKNHSDIRRLKQTTNQLKCKKKYWIVGITSILFCVRENYTIFLLEVFVSSYFYINSYNYIDSDITNLYRVKSSTIQASNN
uniref:Uncharacterized protein n=1 Tax=Schizaphis graminum TaxID=13262 RepID=A0A2S2NB95_SCHGA